MFNCHSESINKCLKELKSKREGLSQDEAIKREAKYGLNELPKEESLGWFYILLAQFNNVLVYILLVAGFLSFLLGEMIDAYVIFGAVVLNVVIGFVQENKANQAITKLKNLVEQKTTVFRDKQEFIINSSKVVPGDILMIKAGNRIPADARLIESVELKVNEASLTGESLPSKKKTEKVPQGAPLADRENMIYAGTIVVQGKGTAVVSKTGSDTELGEIARLVKEEEEGKTPLQLRLDFFSKQLGIIFAIICLLVVLVGITQGRESMEMFKVGVAVGVASIPEGLTVAVTFILALGMQQILKKKALTRRLAATETLGSVTVICTDKTGTLTEGKMHVAHIVIGEREFEVRGEGSRQDKNEARAVSLALQAGMMCNNASVENPGDELRSWRFIGTPTETALLSAAIQSGLNKDKLLKSEPIIGEVPFDSERKYMISLHKKNKGYVLYEKGAPERLLDKSQKYFHKGKLKKILKADRVSLDKTYKNLTNKGLRVIGLAMKDVQRYKADFEKEGIPWEKIDNDLVFIGFIAIKDPLRPEARETIELTRKAGIRPIIITGDHRLTARAIAGEAGLDVELDNIIEGADLDKISDDDLKKVIKKIDIYARVSPHHKLRVVKALQAQKEVVAMTGDGINDSPALKAADIGISLGTATDIAKETSDIILINDNFRTIVGAIKQGRIIFDNIRKVVTYLMSDIFSELILVIGSILLKTPLAITPLQILWINIVNDGFPGYGLAFENSGRDVMKDKPIKKEEPILNKEMKVIIFGSGLTRDAILLLVFLYLWKSGMDIKYLNTLIFASLGVKSLFGIFSLRNFKVPIWRLNPMSNKPLVVAVLASLVLLVAGVEWGPLQVLLSTTGLTLNSWLFVFGFGIFGIFLIEAVKVYFYKKRD